MLIGIEAAHANRSNRTGVEEYCYQIIESLKTTIPPEERVILYTNKPLHGDLAKIPKNWKIKVLRWPFQKMWSQVRLSLEFIFHKPDVFFSPGQLVPFFCPKRTVTMIHDSAFMVYPKMYKFFGRHYLSWMNKRVIKSSSLLITSTDFNKKELIRLYGANISKKIAVIPIAFKKLTVNQFEPKKIGVTKPYILSLGRLETKKNVRQLIHAFTVVKQRDNVQLVLAGKPGVGFKRIEKEIEECPYKEDIINLGYVDAADLGGLLKKATVFAFPSLYEGFGMPVLEAMDIGVPVIAADIEALREVGGQAAIFIDPMDTKTFADKLHELIIDMGEQIKYQHQGRERATLFSWENTAKATWEAIAK